MRTGDYQHYIIILLFITRGSVLSNSIFYPCHVKQQIMQHRHALWLNETTHIYPDGSPFGRHSPQRTVNAWNKYCNKGKVVLQWPQSLHPNQHFIG